MASLLTLGDDAARLLTLFMEGLVTLGIELPCKQCVAPGSIPAWDGEQLTVNLVRIEQGQPGMPSAGTEYHPVFAAAFGISLVREVCALHDAASAGSMVPTQDAIQADGVAAFQDAAALIRIATQIRESYTFTSPGEGFNVGPCTALGPAGMLAGQQIIVTVSLA